MLLYFEDKRGQRRVISTPTTIKDMWKDIRAFLSDHNYKAPYIKINFGENEWVIDLGSWNEFFIVKDFDDEDYKEILKGGWE